MSKADNSRATAHAAAMSACAAPGLRGGVPEPRYPLPVRKPALTGGLGALAAVALLGSCSMKPPRQPSDIGNAAAGRLLVTRMACNSCHHFPGQLAGRGGVGPPLDDFARRQMIAGKLANTTANLDRYLADPTVATPDTIMPDQRLTAAQRRDIAAYLETLR